LRTTKQTYEFQTLTKDFEDPALTRTMPRGTKVKVITTTIDHVPPLPDQPKQVRRELEIPEAFFRAPEGADAKPAAKPGSKGASLEEKTGTIDITDRVL
jgi:hypothetical protein